MGDMNSRGRRPSVLGAKLGKLRKRGRSTIMAALGAPAASPLPALPALQGDALARHHVALALEALRQPGASKPEAFGKLRLLINKLEQGAGHLLAASEPAPSHQARVTNRRARLLNRAFESANLVAAWREERDSTSRA